MTRDEKATVLKSKAVALVSWFEGKEIPQQPFKINAWTTITNPARYVVTQVEILNGNSNPFSRVYVAAYFRLNDLKKYVDELSKTHSQTNSV